MMTFAIVQCLRRLLWFDEIMAGEIASDDDEKRATCFGCTRSVGVRDFSAVGPIVFEPWKSSSLSLPCIIRLTTNPFSPTVFSEVSSPLFSADSRTEASSLSVSSLPLLLRSFFGNTTKTFRRSLSSPVCSST